MNKIDKLSNLHIEVVGVNLENLIFDLSCSGITLKHVKRKNKILRFVVSGQNYQGVLACAKKYDQSVRVVKQSGAINIIKKLPYSIGAFVGIIISCCFVWFETRNVACVDVSIIDRQSQVAIDQTKNEQIKSYLREIGIGEGLVFDSKIKNAENLVAAQFDFVESCTISKNGNYVKVVIKEAAVEPKDMSKIVANTNGIVESVETFAGRAKVKAGDVVKIGQVLVEKVGNVMPKAKIKIKTWTVGTAFHYQNQQKIVRTGKKQVSKSLKILSWQIMGHSNCQFDMYQTEQSTSRLFNVLPFEIQTKVFYETKIEEINEPFEQVEEKIKEQAKNEAIKKAGGTPTSFTYSVVQENGVTKVDCFALVIEEIEIK